MKNRCHTSYWYSEESGKFYVNIDDKKWITKVKEFLKECVKCLNFLWCDKKKELKNILEQNESI
jgi:hypothetical protein